MIAGGAVEAQVFPIENCVIPNDIRGPMAVYVTSDSIPLAGDPQLQKKEAIKAGPAWVPTFSRMRKRVADVLSASSSSIKWTMRLLASSNPSSVSNVRRNSVTFLLKRPDSLYPGRAWKRQRRTV